MLSRFFSTPQPFHYLISILLLSLGSMSLSYWIHDQWEWSFLWSGMLMALSVLLVQFIVLKNELVGKNSYMLYCYTMLLLAVSLTVDSWLFMLYLVLLLLSLRRLLSLKNGKAILPKIFDATFILSIIAVISPVTSVLLLSVFVGVFLFNRGNWRHWSIPLVAIIAVIILSCIIQLYTGWVTVSRLVDGNEFTIKLPMLDWNVGYTVAGIIAISSVIGLLIYVLKLVDIHQRVRPRFSLLVMTGLLSLTLVALYEVAYVIFLVPLLSIFMVRALETMEHRIWKEVLFILPALLLLLAILTA